MNKTMSKVGSTKVGRGCVGAAPESVEGTTLDTAPETSRRQRTQKPDSAANIQFYNIRSKVYVDGDELLASITTSLTDPALGVNDDMFTLQFIELCLFMLDGFAAEFENRLHKEPLLSWVVWQRKAYHDGKLHRRRIKRLERFPNWTWDTPVVNLV